MPEPTDGDKDELPPPLDEPESMDEYWFEKTTITVDRRVKAALEHDRDGQPWNEYLESLRQLKSDPLTFSEVDAIAAHLSDDVREAARAGAREAIEEVQR